MKRLGVAKKRAASCEADGDCDAAKRGLWLAHSLPLVSLFSSVDAFPLYSLIL